MRCHPIRWLWGLIPIAMLSWIAVHVEGDRIEQDLEQRATQALRKAGHDWASIIFSGRNGVLVGTAPRREAPLEAFDLVRSLWGVSSVEGRTRLAETARAMPLPLPNPQRAKPRGEKIALPPIAKSVVMIDTAEAKASDVPPLAIEATLPTALAERRPDAVRAWEPAITPDNEPSTGAQKTQEVPPIAAVETAAIAATAARSAEGCQAAVRTINDSEPVRFARGKTNLDGPSRSVLDRLAVMAGACPQVGLKVVGHSDARGRAKRNLVLSQQRARAVVTYLINKGIDAGRLEAVGYGEARPVAPNDTARNRAKNRRIELEITGAGPQVAPTGQGAGNGLSDR